MIEAQNPKQWLHRVHLWFHFVGDFPVLFHFLEEFLGLERDSTDSYRKERALLSVPRHLADGIDDFNTGDDLPDDRILAVKVGYLLEADKELAPACRIAARMSHGDGAGHVLQPALFNIKILHVNNRSLRVLLSGLWVSSLNQEARQNPVHEGAVI